MPKETLSRLQTYYGHLDALDLLQVMIHDEFKGRIALVSSFGSGSALLLSLVAEINPHTPVLFLETHKHFPETLSYVDTLSNDLGLTNVQNLTPNIELIDNIDTDGTLWQSQPNRCCWLRKVEPLKRALADSPFDALITGRKRYQTLQRSEMDTIELHEDGRFRINPLALWNKDRIEQTFATRNLREHPLRHQGYLSIGCAPCTRPVKEGEDERAGRWAHTAELPGGEKKECGIHVQLPETPEWNI